MKHCTAVNLETRCVLQASMGQHGRSYPKVCFAKSPSLTSVLRTQCTLLFIVLPCRPVMQNISIWGFCLHSVVRFRFTTTSRYRLAAFDGVRAPPLSQLPSSTTLVNMDTCIPSPPTIHFASHGSVFPPPSSSSVSQFRVVICLPLVFSSATCTASLSLSVTHQPPTLLFERRQRTKRERNNGKYG